MVFKNAEATMGFLVSRPAKAFSLWHSFRFLSDHVDDPLPGSL
jgi:hypothetical protein